MLRFLQSLLIICFISGISLAQGDLDLTQFESVNDLESEFEDFNNGILAGMSALDWTDASGPSVFRFSAGIFVGLGGIEKNKLIGIDDDLFTPGGIGLQLGFGTVGFEFYARFLPEFEVSDADLKTLGFGIKYELTNLIPIPAFPSTALFVDYNTMDLSVNDKREIPGVSSKINSEIELKFSTINIGAIMSYDFIVARIYGKLAVELGNTDMSWNSVTNAAGSPVEKTITGDLKSTSFRYAVGLVLFGVKVEVGGRGSNLFAGLGYGISI